MTYATRPTSHLAHILQCDSNIWTASRRAATCGPIAFGEISSRISRITAPTPSLRHRFGPNDFRMTCAEATRIAIETSDSMSPALRLIADNGARGSSASRVNLLRVVKRSLPHQLQRPVENVCAVIERTYA